MPGIISTSPLQLESYEVNFDSATGISSGSVALTDVTNVVGPGVLASIGMVFNGALAGAWSAQLEIQVDGGTTKLLTIMVVGSLGSIKQFQATRGTTDPVNVLIPVGTRFQTSLRVGIRVTVAAGSNTMDCTVCRGVAL